MVRKQSNGHLQNRLLAAIPPKAFSLFASDLRASIFKQGGIVQEVGEPVDQIYFPQTGMISLVVVTQEGIGIEAASIGREGPVGLHRGLGKRRSFTRAVIQVSGTISHISADVSERAVGRSDAIKEIITHYTEVLWSKPSRLPHVTPFTARKRGLPDGCCKCRTELIRTHFL
jgi:CRP-like cAMP-binding protein